MDIAYIDQLSNNGGGCLNKASAISKILMTVCIIVSVILCENVTELAVIFAVLLLLIVVNKMPLGKILHIAAYPVFFSLLFALMRFSYSVEMGFVVLLKGANAAVAMILLMVTTPYPLIFSFLRLFLPGVVVDGLLFTYRTFFILLDKLQKALTVIKLRGGFRPFNIIFNVKNLAGVIGVLFIHAFDMSERMYNIYSLRGYEGRLVLESKWYGLKKWDCIPLGIGIIILALVVVL
ncbi:MAG: hypothetical protein GX066_02270 [Clostridiaceae bacterium]|nr:hypothetical protein [Clostridiaceae bacterium]